MNSLQDIFLDPKVYGLVFHNNVCHVCKTSENLMKCSRCDTVAYCSKIHQILDWKVHKEICRVMTKALEKTQHVIIDNYMELFRIRKWRLMFVQKELGRTLQLQEVGMVLYKRFCEFCYCENNIKLECPDCNNVFYCSENHRDRMAEKHSKNCHELKICKELNSTWIFNKTDMVIQRVVKSLDISQDQKYLPTSILELLELYDKNSTNVSNDVKPYLLKLHWLSPAATILYALENIGSLNDRLFHKKNLIIHIVSMSKYETTLDWKEILEIMFHWIKNLTDLEYYIVGPQLYACTGFRNRFSKYLCDKCKVKKVKTSCSIYDEGYHHVVRDLKKPDMVVCFNSELSNLKSHWNESIWELVKVNIPLILTSHSLFDLHQDVNEIRNITKDRIEIFVEPQINPFRDHKPYRENDQNDPVHYDNGFISILRLV